MGVVPWLVNKEAKALCMVYRMVALLRKPKLLFFCMVCKSVTMVALLRKLKFMCIICGSGVMVCTRVAKFPVHAWLVSIASWLVYQEAKALCMVCGVISWLTTKEAKALCGMWSGLMVDYQGS